MSTILDDPGPALARRLREEREARSWSLADLAEQSGVSKAMLSKIEREETSPTAALLVQIATAFDLTLAQLLTTDDDQDRRLLRAREQAFWRDPLTSYTRRQVFLSRTSPLELAEIVLPRGKSVSMAASSYELTRHVVWMLDGELTLLEGDQKHKMLAGDRLEFGPPSDVTFSNRSAAACRYLVAVVRR